MSVPAPVGRWWLTYDDGAVWPCEVLGPTVFFVGHWRVRAVEPAPDAGETRVEPAGRIIDSAGNRPGYPPA